MLEGLTGSAEATSTVVRDAGAGAKFARLGNFVDEQPASIAAAATATIVAALSLTPVLPKPNLTPP